MIPLLSAAIGIGLSYQCTFTAMVSDNAGYVETDTITATVEDDETKYDLICKILKNRKGPKGSRWLLDLDPANLRIGPDA